MTPRRSGVALPVVLMVILALSVLSALTLLEATQRWRLALLSREALEARLVAAEGEWWLRQPRALALLCLGPPVAVEETTFNRSGGGEARATLQHLGGGVVRGRVLARVRRGRYGVERLLRTDSALTPGPPAGCPTAQALIPIAERHFGRLGPP